MKKEDYTKVEEEERATPRQRPCPGCSREHKDDYSLSFILNNIGSTTSASYEVLPM